MLGLRGGIITTDSHFGPVSYDFAMDDVKCKGNEASLQQCSHTTKHNCGGLDGLGVICNKPTGLLITQVAFISSALNLVT